MHLCKRIYKVYYLRSNVSYGSLFTQTIFVLSFSESIDFSSLSSETWFKAFTRDNQ